MLHCRGPRPDPSLQFSRSDFFLSSSDERSDDQCLLSSPLSLCHSTFKTQRYDRDYRTVAKVPGDAGVFFCSFGLREGRAGAFDDLSRTEQTVWSTQLTNL